MTTIGSPVYCGNSNYPLWLANGRPIDSPTTVIDNLTKAFTTVVNESNTTTAYNDYPATTQPYASIVYTKDGGTGSNSGLFLQTNGQTNLAINGGGNAIQTFRPVQVSNAEGSFLQINPEGISLNGIASNAITITDGGGFSLGNTVDITSQVLAVYNGATNTEADLRPTSLTLGTYANTTSATSEDFSLYTLAGPTYYAVTPTFAGITWTSTSGASPLAGITRVNPAYSSKAVTITGGAFPGTTAQGAYLGGFSTTPVPPGTFNGFILPTLSVAQPGDTVQLSYAYVGTIAAGRVIINGIQVLTIPSQTVWTAAVVNFISTGNDEVEFQVQSVPYTTIATNFNVTNITFSYTVASVSTPEVSVSTLGRNSGNYGVLALRSLYTDGTTVGNAIVIGDSTASNSTNFIGPTTFSSGVSLANNNIVNVNDLDAVSVNNTGATLTIGATSSNVVISNLGTFTATTVSASSSVNTPALDNPGGFLNIGGTSGSVQVQNASGIFTATLDAVTALSNIFIGGSSLGAYLYHVGSIEGRTGGAAMSNIKYLNNDAACATGIHHYTPNFTGYKTISMPLPPKQILTGRNNNTFGNNYSGDSYISSQGFTLPAYSVFSYSNIGSGTTTTISNNQTIPYYYADSGPGFSPSSSAQSYSLVPLIT